MTQFSFGDGRTGTSERSDHSNNHKMTKVHTKIIALFSLSESPAFLCISFRLSP